MNKIIEIRNLCKKYYTKDKEIVAIDDISFDVYEGENIDSSKKSVAFKLVFNGLDRTLTDEEVMSEFNKIIDKVVSTYNAELRDK